MSDHRPDTASAKQAALAALRRELNLEFVHECCGGVRIHAELVQTFAELGDVAGTCYALRRLFAHAKAAHPVYVELRDGLRLPRGARAMTGFPRTAGARVHLRLVDGAARPPRPRRLKVRR